MIVRSPKSCVRSLTYGVSPQPEQAPENSKRGSRNCVPFTSIRTVSRGASGRSRKKAKLAASASRSGRCGCMSSDLCFGFDLSFAGQTATQRVQPVQSSGATCTVYFFPLYSVPLKSIDLKVGGALARSAGSYTFTRMAAWGQTIAHLLHWMQIFSSQTGMSRAMFRFSHLAVDRGQVPSGGKALTGRRSPLPASMTAETRWTKSGAASETIGGRFRDDVTFPGTGSSWRCSSVPSIAAKFFLTISGPFRP